MKIGKRDRASCKPSVVLAGKKLIISSSNWLKMKQNKSQKRQKWL
jgi:hypothetical protein